MIRPRAGPARGALRDILKGRPVERPLNALGEALFHPILQISYVRNAFAPPLSRRAVSRIVVENVTTAPPQPDHVHFRRAMMARPITQSLSLSLRKLSSSVKWLMRWR